MAIATILTTNGYSVQIDAEDLELVNKHSWCATAPSTRLPESRYAIAQVYDSAQKKQQSLLMHRLIMSAPKGSQVDHVDGDGLNNCRSNLRICNQSQNNANTRRRVGKSGFRGVHKRGNRFIALISSGCRTGAKARHIGSFLTAEEAAAAFDKEAIKAYGEFATLNFPRAS